MKELFEAAVSAANIIPTTLFIFVIIYWITVIIGILDLDFLDFDIDVDVEMDMDMEADGEISISWLNNLLGFFNLGKVPLMIFATFLVMPMWVISIMGNDYLGNHGLMIGLILLIPGFLVSVFIAKFCTMPFIRLFSKMDEGIDKHEELVGKVCSLNSSCTEIRIGQAKIESEGAPYIVNVKTTTGTTLKPGDTGLLIEYNRQDNTYLIEPYIN